MNDRPEEENEEGPDTDSDGKGKASVRGRASHSGASHRGGAHAVVPSTLRGSLRARAARNKIKDTLTDATFDNTPVDNHYNKR